MASQETLSELIKELDELRNQYDALQRSLLLLPLYDSDNEAIRGLQSGDVFSNGNTGFVLCCSALVMLMSLPGISLFYSGAVKVQNVMVTFIQTMTISAVVSILWMACGYSLAFSPADSSTDHVSVYGDYGRMWLIGMDMDSVHQMAPTIPETAFCMFQLSKAILACTLLMGGFACRTKFLSVLVFISFWLVLVLCPLSHMHGHPAGWMFKMDVLDFAGGNVVHISSGITAYLASYFIGPRSDTKEQARFESRNILLCVWGACFMFIGWFGFNMGSAYCTSYSSSRSMLITVLGASSAAIAWISIEWFLTGTPSILGMLCGSVAGLVSMSAGAGYIDHTGAVVTGAVSGVTCYLVVAKKVMAVDDPLNTFSLNFFGGVVGSLCVGLFSKQHDHSQEFHDNEYAMGAFFGNPKQVRRLSIWSHYFLCHSIVNISSGIFCL